MSSIHQTTTADAANRGFVIKASTHIDVGEVSALLASITKAQQALNFVAQMQSFSDLTGSYVLFDPNTYFIPHLLGTDNKRVFLSEFIETLDGLVDYAAVQQELPNLSISQVNGAISFLRKVAQFNVSGHDFDELEDGELTGDTELIAGLTKALSDKEKLRVLHND